MNIISTNKEELSKHTERKGFVFSANSPSSDASIKNLAHVLIARNVTKSMPELVGKLGNSVVFIYGEDFDGPMFFAGAGMAQNMGICQVESISEFISRISG